MTKEQFLKERELKLKLWSSSGRFKTISSHHPTAQMASSSSLAFFLALVCLTAGVPLPLKEGTSVQSLITASFTLWEGLPQPTALLDQVNSSLGKWSEAFVEAMQDTLTDRILDPFTKAYYEEFNSTDVEVQDKELSFDASVIALIVEKPFLEVVIELCKDPANAFLTEVRDIQSAIAEIVVDLPNWMDIRGLMKVDLSKVDFNGQGLFQVLLTNIKVPEYQQKNFMKIQNSVNSLSSGAAIAGRNSAKSVKKTLRYLKTKYPMTEAFLPTF